MEEEDISSEDIKHLVFRSEPDEIKFPIYRSKFSAKVRHDAKLGKQCHLTMGLPDDYPPVDPSKDYLKKQQKIIIRPIVDIPKPPGGPRSRVPQKHEWNKKPARVEPNFILQNLKRIENAIPPTGPSRWTDAKGRCSHNCNLMIPKFIFKEGFGKVPGYLSNIKSELKKIKQEAEHKQKEYEEARAKKMPKFRCIPAEERLEILNNLKDTWAKLQKDFQLLPMLNDTPPKIKRKRQLEQDLAKLEKEIQMLEDHQVIYVYDEGQDWSQGKINVEWKSS